MLEPLKRMALRSCLSQRHAACLFRGNQVYAYGVNKYFQMNVPDYKKMVPITIHAEMDALFSVGTKYTKHMDILIIRVNRQLTLKNSRPCNVCIDKLRQKKIRRAYYTNDKGDVVYEYVDRMPKLHESSANRYRHRHQCCAMENHSYPPHRHHPYISSSKHYVAFY